ncbi:MAG TPA: gamma-glutamyltransferase [Bryobacteraceae bacterium]|nr:gamma-glutamyltransferase [Bryobacteraceae bacterium]
MRKLVLLLALSVSCFAAQPVRGRHGMVVTRETHATEAGLNVLKSGGNAVDAAVAVGFALAVTHSSAGNIGGGGFMLVRMADGRTAFIDFRERAPEAASHDMYLDAAGKPTQDSTLGYRASGIPGTARGLEYASKKFGTKPWAELVRPAVKLATQGFPLSYAQANSLRNARGLAQFAESNRIFLRNGKFYEAGDIFVQPELGRTLERIAQLGAADFYEGETARLLAQDMKEHGGLITLADLKGYKVIERPVLTGKYRGFDIITSPPPSSGGVGILQMLGMLEGTSYEKGGAGSAEVVHYMTEAMRRYFADRSEYLGDPDFYKVPLTSLLEPSYIRHRRDSIDREKATASSEVHPAVEVHPEANETTHYTVADGQGNIAMVTYTLNGGYGSKVTATGLGFLLNNEMDDFAAKPGAPNMFGLVQGEANAIQPRKTPLSSMVPTIVMRDGKPYLALGSPGGPTIINTVLEVMVNVLDFHMNVQEAVNWPRFHHQWLPDQLSIEPGYSPDTIALLEQHGYKVRRVNAQGECAAILLENGWLEGAADPRTEGTAQGY